MEHDSCINIEDLEKYYFPCWRCGNDVELLTPHPILRVFCKNCKEAYLKEKEEILKEYIKLKTIVMHERALRILEKQEAELHLYMEASQAVLEFALEDPERFSSSHEMIAAMELIRNQVKIKVQQKILNHRVDFVIPSMKVILEIDGYMHDYTRLKDRKRDIAIRNALGDEWEIVRIPTKYIEQNAKALLTAIREVYKLKKDVRKQNGGIIPEWYSKREKALYKKVTT